jgi:uncharacterized cupin superfamily protein
MQKINLSAVPTQHRRSPKGRFELTRQHVSLALGGKKDIGPWGGGHPFDIELSILPPGKLNYPLHSHVAQTEYYIVLSGHGLIRDDTGTELELSAGDHVICLPGDAHQIENTSAEPLLYYVIADHHRAEITSYPRTGKRYLKPEDRVLNPTDVDYYAGEE